MDPRWRHYEAILNLELQGGGEKASLEWQIQGLIILFRATHFLNGGKFCILTINGKVVLLAISECIGNKIILLNYGLILLLATTVEPKAYSLFLKIGF